MKINFEEYLEKQFDGSMFLDDDLENACNTWIENLDVQKLIDYADKYAEGVYQERSEELIEKYNPSEGSVEHSKHKDNK